MNRSRIESGPDDVTFPRVCLMHSPRHAWRTEHDDEKVELALTFVDGLHKVWMLSELTRKGV